MISAQSERFDKPLLLLCEGVSDERFFLKLFEVHSISDYHVRYPFREHKYSGGRSCFGEDLRFIALSETFITNVRGVLIVSDNDEDPAASFAEVQQQLQTANFPVPMAEREIALAKLGPAVAILMLPPNQTGNLEKLCLQSAYAKWPLRKALDAFVEQTPAAEWGESKQSKMRMQSILAATNSKQPDCGFGGHWNQPDHLRIPLAHSCFDPVVAFLKQFPTLLGA